MAPPFTLPGFIEPLNFVPHPTSSLFPTALYGDDMDDDEDARARLPITTLRELAMLRFMNEITDKDHWSSKIKKDTIANKWKQEAQRQANFSERMATYCIDELRWRADEFEETGFVFVFNGDVVKSDVAVSDNLKARLQAAVEKIEAASSQDKDYHPNSDDKVWDLVHPSLFPLVYGTSRILRNEVIVLDDCLDKIGVGEVVPVPPEKQATWQLFTSAQQPPFSRKFQWLPCDVQFFMDETEAEDSGGASNVKCFINSYINNLHPRRHRDMYTVLEEVISATLPLWNETLLAHEGRPRLLRIPYKHRAWYDPDPNTLVCSPADIDHNDTVAGQAWWEALCAARRQCLVFPEPFDFEPPDSKMSSSLESLPLFERYADGGFQIIVKLATIELTPDKPTYEGGSWHVEGQLNEHICATALYYYSVENITESRLGFRQMCNASDLSDVLDYEQNDDTFLEPIFGCVNHGAGVQDVGSVLCKEGRLLTFPNTLQHRVLPFELTDKTKPGHRKILALFLVDPNIHIISTSSVPPQRLDWWKEAVYTERNKLGGLSGEQQDNVANMMDFPLSMEQAKALRLELMEERKVYEVRHAGQFESVEFSLCEH